MKEQFGDQMDLQIRLGNSAEAKQYQVRGSTTVFLDNKWVPLEIAISEERMADHVVAEGVHKYQVIVRRRKEPC